MPPEMGLSGPRTTGCAGASVSDFTAGPPPETLLSATATGRPAPGGAPLSSEASTTGAALFVRLLDACCAELLFDACCAAALLPCEGFGCALACAFVPAAGCGCAAVEEAGCVAGCAEGDAAGCVAGCDIFAIT